MVNLRYHIVSLVAVFLALAIGVIAGTTVIDQGVVNVLRSQSDSLRASRDGMRIANEGLTAELDVWERFGEAVLRPLTLDRLADAHVVIVSESAVSQDIVDSVDDAILRAGGAVVGRIAFTDKWPPADQIAVDQLTVALDADGRSPEELIDTAAQRLANRLRTPRTVDDADLLQRLARAGFLTVAELGDRPFPVRGAAVVFLSDGQGRDGLPETLMLPMLRRLARAVPVAVGEPLNVPDPLVIRIRGDAALRTMIATVDDVDTLPGVLAFVLAVADRVGGGPARHYGIGRGAEAIVPDVTP